MTVTEIYQQIKEFIIQTIPEEDQNLWKKAELNVEIQPNMTSMNGIYYLVDLNNPLEIRDKRKNRSFMDILRAFHNITTQSGLNKWNKAQFSLFPQTELETKLLWDQEWQNAQDDAVKKVQEEDPSYIGPKWHWEE